MPITNLVDLNVSSDSIGNSEDNEGSVVFPSASILVRQAEQLYEAQCPEEAHRVARQAYAIDQYDSRGVLIYIACMVDLGLKTELFYLGHKLANSSPKSALTWYAIGCYYWCCNKLELSQKYLNKATKIDKRFAKAWIVLGHVLAAQEESDNGISAFRTASRLLPGDHRPLVYMARELVRTNNLSLALILLLDAIKISPKDAIVLNEIGVVYLKLDRFSEAASHLETAANLVHSSRTGEPLSFGKKGFGAEVHLYYYNIILYFYYCLYISYLFSFLRIDF